MLSLEKNHFKLNEHDTFKVALYINKGKHFIYHVNKEIHA